MSPGQGGSGCYPAVSHLPRQTAAVLGPSDLLVFVTGKHWHDITTETQALSTNHGDCCHTGRKQSHNVKPECSDSAFSSGSCLRTLIPKPRGLCSLWPQQTPQSCPHGDFYKLPPSLLSYKLLFLQQLGQSGVTFFSGPTSHSPCGVGGKPDLAFWLSKALRWPCGTLFPS